MTVGGIGLESNRNIFDLNHHFGLLCFVFPTQKSPLIFITPHIVKSILKLYSQSTGYAQKCEDDPAHPTQIRDRQIWLINK